MISALKEGEKLDFVDAQKMFSLIDSEAKQGISRFYQEQTSRFECL